MPLATETVNIDITLPDGTEFDSVTFVAQLSDATWDTVDNQAVPRAPVSVELDSNGTGTIELWPNDRGIKQTYYTAVVQGILSDTNAKRDYQIGKFFPSDGDGPFDLNALLSIGFDETIITPTLVQRAETAAEEAEASATAASTSASNASTSASNAATSASNAAASASSAETYADQAELAAISAGAPLFDSTSDGLAGTSDGDIFLIRTAQGLQTYRNDAGSATFLGWLGPVVFNTVAEVLADDADTYGGDGTLVEAGGFRYIEDSTATAPVGFIENSATVPVKLRYLRDDMGYYHGEALGCVLDGVTDDTAALEKTVNAAIADTYLVSLTGDCAFDPTFLASLNPSAPLQFYYQTLSPTTTIVINTQIFLEGRAGISGGAYAFPPLGAINGISGAPTVKFEGVAERGISNTAIQQTDDIGILVESPGNTICANVFIKNCDHRTVGAGKSSLQIDNAFWVWVENCSFRAGSSALSCIEVIATKTLSYAGLLRFKDVRMAGSGFRLGGKSTVQEIATIAIEDCLTETARDSFIVIDSDDAALIHTIRVYNSNIADNDSATYMIEILGSPQNVSDITWNSSAALPLINKPINGLIINSAKTPSSQSGAVDLGSRGPGTSVLSDGVFSGEWDGQGGLFGPVAPAATVLDVDQDAANWSPVTSGTVTTGLLAPDGTNTAASIEDGAIRVFSSVVPLAPDDWVIFGVWGKGIGTEFATSTRLENLDGTWKTWGSGDLLNFGREIALRNDLGWTFVVQVDQVDTIDAGQLQVTLRSQGGGVGEIAYWKPFVLHIPASVGMDAANVYRIARHSVNVMSDAMPGVASQFPHQTLRTGTGITGDRPTGTLPAGSQWFDTTLAQPIWADGSGGWVDATGTSV